MAGGGAPVEGSYLALMGDEDSITGFLLAGVGNVDLRKNSNFLIVNESELSLSIASDFCLLLLTAADEDQYTADAYLLRPSEAVKGSI